MLTSSTGRYCVKIFNKKRTDNNVKNYIDRIELASTLDINTPKIYRINGDCLQAIEINDNQYRLCVIEYIDGKSFYDLNEIPTDSEIKEIIKQMVKIHNTKLTSDFIYNKWIITNFIKEYKDETGKLWIMDFAISNYLPRVVDLAVTSCNLCLNHDDKDKTIESTRMIINEYQKYTKLTDYELEVFPLLYDLANAMGILHIVI